MLVSFRCLGSGWGGGERRIIFGLCVSFVDASGSLILDFSLVVTTRFSTRRKPRAVCVRESGESCFSFIPAFNGLYVFSKEGERQLFLYSSPLLLLLLIASAVGRGEGWF